MSVDTHAPATAAEQFALRQQSPVQRIQHLLHSHPAISPLLVLIVAMIVFTIINPRFAQPGTLSIIIQQTAIIAALAIGQTLIVLTAGIDLSVGAICILSMLFMANLAANNGVPGLSWPCSWGRARTRCAALLNGVLVTRLNLPPFIVTLGTLSIFGAIGLLYTGGASVAKAGHAADLECDGHSDHPWTVPDHRRCAVRHLAGDHHGLCAEPDSLGSARVRGG